MAQLAPLLKFRWFDSNGEPLVGGKVHTYVANTTTPLATYTDPSGGTPNANPVILDSAGSANIYMTAGAYYKFIITDADDSVLETFNNITLPGTGAAGASFIAGTGAPDDVTDGSDGDTYLDISNGTLYGKSDGEWDTIGTLTVGDVAGPASSTDDRIATFDGTTGKIIQDGGSTIANVLDRANHTGSQAASTISDFSTEVDARIGAASIDDLSDVDTTTDAPANGDVLVWDTDKWVPGESSGGGGGGAGLELYLGQSNAPIESILSNGRRLLDFSPSPDEQEVFAEIKVPSSYVAGDQIQLIGGRFFAAETSGNALFQSVAYLFKAGIDGTSTPTGHTSTNAQVAVSGSANFEVAIGAIDLTDADGEINNVALAAGDTIFVKIVRKTSSETSALAGNARLVRHSFEPKYDA